MHKIIVDTEFTELFVDDAKPISIALVDVVSGDSCYVELDGWEPWDCSQFVAENVLPQLTGPSLTYEQASHLLLDFLEAHQPFELMSDAPTFDFDMLRQVLGSQCPIKRVSGLTDLKDLVEEGDENPHHALVDAQLLAAKVRHFEKMPLGDFKQNAHIKARFFEGRHFGQGRVATSDEQA